MEKKFLSIPTIDNKEYNNLVTTKTYELIMKEKNGLNSNYKSSRNLHLLNLNSIKNSKTLIIKKDTENNTIQNYRNNKNKKFETNFPKKINLNNMAINDSKLLIFKTNKNHNLLNIENPSKSNDERKNKYLFERNKKEEFQKAKEFYSSRNLKFSELNGNKIPNLNSPEKENDLSNSLKKINENKNNPISINNFLNISSNNMKKNIGTHSKNKTSTFKSIREILPYINTNEKEKNSNKNKIKLNLNIINKDNKNLIKKNSELKDIECSFNSLSIKEKACYILTKSDILNLKQKIIFSRSCSNLRSLTSPKDIINSYINNKIKELEEKIKKFSNKMESPFSPSKLSSISLNLISKEDEEDFKYLEIKEENEKYYYFVYIKLIFLLLGKEITGYDNEDNKLYEKLENININIKDYLYKLLVKKKTKKKILEEKDIDKFNELFEELPDLVKHDGIIKESRFISFSYFILKELNNHFKDIKKNIENKSKIKNYINCLKKNLSNVNNNYN